MPPRENVGAGQASAWARHPLARHPSAGRERTGPPTVCGPTRECRGAGQSIARASVTAWALHFPRAAAFSGGAFLPGRLHFPRAPRRSSLVASLLVPPSSLIPY
jgi:hypothetical protein